MISPHWPWKVDATLRRFRPPLRSSSAVLSLFAGEPPNTPYTLLFPPPLLLLVPTHTVHYTPPIPKGQVYSPVPRLPALLETPGLLDPQPHSPSLAFPRNSWWKLGMFLRLLPAFAPQDSFPCISPKYLPLNLILPCPLPIFYSLFPPPHTPLPLPSPFCPFLVCSAAGGVRGSLREPFR